MIYVNSLEHDEDGKLVFNTPAARSLARLFVCLSVSPLVSRVEKL